MTVRALLLTRVCTLTRTLGAGALGGVVVVVTSGAPYLPVDAPAYLTLAGREYHVNACDLQYQTAAGDEYQTAAGEDYLAWWAIPI